MPTEKKKTYVVKSSITHGKHREGAEDITAAGGVDYVEYKLGDKIELTEKEARAIAHALVDPPSQPSRRAVDEDEPEEENEDDYEDVEEAVDSIRSRPDHPDSGVHMAHQTDPVANAHAKAVEAAVQEKDPAKALAKLAGGTTAEVGGGFERANTGTGATGATTGDQDKK
jgi:hypothetical protein